MQTKQLTTATIDEFTWEIGICAVFFSLPQIEYIVALL